MPTTAGTAAPGIAFPRPRLGGGGAAARGGRGADRQDAHARVRVGQRHAAGPQSLGPRAHSVGIERRLRRRGGGGACAGGHGLRHRRLDPHPGGVLRHRRAQADVRPREPRRHRAAQLVARSCGPADAHRGRRGAHAQRARRLRPARPGVPGPAGARLHDRARAAASKGLRIGVCRNHFFDRNQEDVERAVEARHRRSGRAGRDGPSTSRCRSWSTAWPRSSRSSWPHRRAYHDARCAAGRLPHFQPDVRTLVEMGRLVTGSDYLKAEQVRARLMEDFRELFEQRGCGRRADRRRSPRGSAASGRARSASARRACWPHRGA